MQSKFLFLAIAFIACGERVVEPPEEETGLLANTDFEEEVALVPICERQMMLGNSSICIPQITGFKECYLDPGVKDYVDMYDPPGSQTFAFYVNDSTYKKINKIDSIEFEDYCKIYTMNSMVNQKAPVEFVAEMDEVIRKGYIETNWVQLKSKIARIMETRKMTESDISEPTIVESYSLSPNSRSYITLLKYSQEDNDVLKLGSMNVVVIRDRLIFVAYYRNLSSLKTF